MRYKSATKVQHICNIHKKKCEKAYKQAKWAVMPAAVGLLLGMLFLLAIDELTPHLHTGATSPEGMAVGVEELIPKASQGEHSNLSTIGFALGFVVMMVLDVVLG